MSLGKLKKPEKTVLVIPKHPKASGNERVERFEIGIRDFWHPSAQVVKR